MALLKHYRVGLAIVPSTPFDEHIYDTFRMAPLDCCWWHNP